MAVDIGYCKYCEKIINKKYGEYCNQCVKLIDSNLARAKAELYENPDITFNELVEKEGINAEIILILMRQGRLMWKTSNVLSCVICGKSISQGNLCSDCHASLDESIRRCTEHGASNEDFSSDKKIYTRQANVISKNNREIHVTGMVDKLKEGS